MVCFFFSSAVAAIFQGHHNPFAYGFDSGNDKDMTKMSNHLLKQLIDHGWLVFVNDHRNVPPTKHSLSAEARYTIATCFCNAYALVIFNVFAKFDNPDSKKATNDFNTLGRIFVRECRKTIVRNFDIDWKGARKLAKCADMIDCYNQVLELCSDDFRPYVVKALAPSNERQYIPSWYAAHDYNLPVSEFEWDSASDSE